METNTIEVGSFEVNCTIVSDGTSAWIVDPGSEAVRIAAIVERKCLKPAGILLTHGHFDHIGAVDALQKRWPGMPVYVDEKDIAVIVHPMNSFPPDYPPVPRPQNIRPAAENPIAKAIETPGHTPGGICYYIEGDKLLLSGDTLFAGSVGRTDLPGGDMDTLSKSLAKLKALPDEVRVIPGHGPATSIGDEKRSNPFLV